ncbi:phenylalanine--tRNA ligase beta subunit-related protein [Brenneria goodwinii]|uniref:B3/B4 domain-containing protein n=1 Tax=Brenneria goodwinii TaxID=1109412 RepID=UPI0036E05DD9
MLENMPIAKKILSGGRRCGIHLPTTFGAIGVDEVVAAELYNIDNAQPLLPDIAQSCEAEARRVCNTPDEVIRDNSILQSYREMIHQRGRSNKKFPPSAEALIAIVKRKRQFHHINTLVDIYNLAALEHYLSFGVHDMDMIKGDIWFRFSPGGEAFIPIGGGNKATAKEDYVYADAEKVLAWLDSRDSDLAKVSPATKNVLIVVQGNAATSAAYRIHALNALCRRIVRNCGGEFTVYTISAKDG